MVDDDEGAAAEGIYFEGAEAAETWGVMEKERCLGIRGGIGVRDFCSILRLVYWDDSWETWSYLWSTGVQ